MPGKDSPDLLLDGLMTAERGADSGRRPNMIGLSQVAWARNVTFRDGYPKNRPAYEKLTLDFSEIEAAAFQDGRFQGMGVYEPDTGDPYLVLAISGAFFRSNLIGNKVVQDISIPGDPNPTNRLQVWFVQGENYLVAQDGQSSPWIHNGASSRRAQWNEIKTGTVGAYGKGRFTFANPGGRSFRMYDLVGGPSGTAANRYRDAVLKDTENDFLNEGGDFSVGVHSGPITAIKFLTVPDTSTGQGPLHIFTTHGIFTVDAPVDRTTWKEVSFPIQTISMIEYGALGQNSTISVNGDQFYRAQDGIRSYILAQRQFREWGNTPISSEMKRALNYDNRALLGFSSAVLIDNRVLTTVSPAWSDHGVYHRGLAVLDFDLVSAMGQSSPPAWEGIWTDIRVLQLVKTTLRGVERCYAAVLNAEDKIEIWEITTSGRLDHRTDRIQSIVETRAMDWKNPRVLKELYGGFVHAMEMVGEVDFNIQWKPDQYPAWIDWVSWEECAKANDCVAVDGCLPLLNMKPQFRPRMGLPQPPDGCDPITSRPYRHLYESQVRLAWTGTATIKALGAIVSPRRETVFTDCEPVSGAPCETLDVCAEPDFEMT